MSKIKNKKIYLLILIALILVIMMVWLIKPYSKSKTTITLSISNILNMESSPQEISVDIEDEEEETETQSESETNEQDENKEEPKQISIVLPYQINQRNVVIYYDENEEEIEPGQIYILSQDEITSKTIQISALFEDEIEQLGDVETIASTYLFSGGSGTINNPYKISTVQDMDDLAYVVTNYVKDTDNNKYYTFEYYELTNDIDYNLGEITPIGLTTSNSINNSFQGVFDGKGHKIINGKITVNEYNFTQKAKFGIFASIYSSKPSQRATIRNLEVDNVHIYNTTNTAATKDAVYGILCGATGRYSSIVNCIVKNSSIEFSEGFTLGNELELAIGGLTGDIIYNSLSSATTNVPSLEEQNIIENCFVDVDISVPDSSWAENGTSSRYYQYVIGGIVGRIRSQEKMPENSIYTGTITASKAFIGPIYANCRYNVSKETSNYMSAYLGINASGAAVGSMNNCYFYNYKINNGQLHEIDENYQTELNEETLDAITGYVLDTDYMGRVQGINRGQYLESIYQYYDFFNSYSEIGSVYNRWNYDIVENKFTFGETSNPYETQIIKNATHNYSVVSNLQTNPNVTYKWYVNNVIQVETTDTIFVSYGDISQERILKCEIFVDGEISDTKTILIEPETLDLVINIDDSDDQEKLFLDIYSSFDISLNDYTYSWYKKEKEQIEFNLIPGENSSEYIIDSRASFGDTYKLVAINKYNESYNKEVLFVYEDIIYVNYQTTSFNSVTYPIGSDHNNGRTPQTAVKTLEKAYQLLDEEKTWNDNIVVIMGDYTQELTQDTFSKPATVVGEYQDINWNGKIRLNISSQGQSYNTTCIYADTIFRDISLDCSNQNQFLYCQGNNLIMDTNTNIFNPSKGETAWGLPNTNYSGFSLIGGWLNYSETIPIPTDVCTIEIKSGCYGRIIAGSRRVGTDANASYCFATLDDPFKIEITIDIEDDEQNKGTFAKSIGSLMGGQPDGNCCINNVINLINGSVEKVYGGNLGYGRETPNKPTDSYWGSTQLNLIGGTVESIFGASYGRLGTNENSYTKTYFYGKIEINLTGTKINNSLYGAGAGGVTGYDAEKSTDVYKDWVINRQMTDIDGNTFRLDETTITINMSDDAEINGCLYAGGYGYSFGLIERQLTEDSGAFYGDVYVNISGGTIKGNVYGGGCGTEVYETTKTRIASMVGNVTLNISDDPRIEGSIFGGGKGSDIYEGMGSIEGNVYINIEDATLGNYIVTDIYGAGEGYSANVTGNSYISIDNTTVAGNIYGGGYSADVSENTYIELKSTNVETTNRTVSRNERGGEVYGGGEGEQSVINGFTNIKIDNCIIETRVCGGGDSGQVLGGTDVQVYGRSNVLKSVYGGGNGTTGSVGTLENPANTNVIVQDAMIGNFIDNSETGEVFGGGNYGTVYGNTTATIGSTNPLIETNVKFVFYAGGRGEAGGTTVYGDSNAYIVGINTELGSYGSTILGEVAGNVNITFDEFRTRSILNKYKYMSGINKATNLSLIDSYIYLTGGLIDITNLIVPEDSGIMISADSDIYGDFTGGGNLYLQNEVCLTIEGNMYDSNSSDTKTTIILNPEFFEAANCYMIKGNSYFPYIKVLGNDYSSGFGIESGESSLYKIYSLNKDDNIDGRYNTTSKSFESMNESDSNGEKYRSTANPADTRIYYKEVVGEEETYYILTNDLELTRTSETIDSIYYIEKDVVVTSYSTINIVSQNDRVYNSELTQENNIYALSDGYFTTNVQILFRMLKEVGVDIIDTEGFDNLKRYLYLTNNGKITQFPTGTILTMIVDGKYYTKQITQEDSQDISLEDFVGATGNYEEISDIKYHVSEIEDPIWGIDENFRFIIDFSECENYLPNGTYDVLLRIEEQEETNILIYTDVNNNSVLINNRNYEATIETNKNEYASQDNIIISGNLKLKAIAQNNLNDIGKDIVAVVKLKDNRNNYIDIPKGTIVKLNDIDYIFDGECIVPIIENLDYLKYTQNYNISLDFSNVPDKYKLESGNYWLEMKYYISSDNILEKNNPILTKTTSFYIRSEENYGIKITSIDKDIGQRDDQVQLITSKEDVTKIINLQYSKGTLEDQTYIRAKTYKRQADGSFIYYNLDVTLAQDEQVQVPSSRNLTSSLTFNSTLENGTYRIVYEIVNKESFVLTSCYTHFVVIR